MVPEFSVGAGALLVVTCWLTVALIDVEDPVQRLITLSHARRLWPVLAGAVLTVLIFAFRMTIASETWAVFVHRGGDLGELGLGAFAHLACACVGIAIGLPCSRLLIGRVGWSVLAALLVLIPVLLAPWIPLIHPMPRAMAAGTDAGGPVLLGVVASALTLAVSTVTVGVVVRRRF